MAKITGWGRRLHLMETRTATLETTGMSFYRPGSKPLEVELTFLRDDKFLEVVLTAEEAQRVADTVVDFLQRRES